MTLEVISKKALSQVVWTFSSTGIQLIMQFTLMIILSRLISPGEFGLIAAAQIYIGFSYLFSELGVGLAIIQRKELDESHISAAYFINICVGCSLTFVTYFLSDFIAYIFRMNELSLILKWLSIVFAVKSGGVVGEALLQRNFQFKNLAIYNFASYLFGYAVPAVSLAIIKKGVWALVVANIIQSLLYTLFIARKRKIHFKVNNSKQVYKDLFYFGGGITLSNIFSYFALKGDNFIVGRYLGADALGFYSRAYHLMEIPSQIFTNSVKNILFSSMSKIQDELEVLKSVYLRSLSLTALVTFPVSIFTIFYAKECVILVFGSQWANVATPLQLLSFGIFFRTSYKISDLLVISKGLVYHKAAINIVYSAIVIISAFYGQIIDGINGVAAGILLALFLNFALITILAFRALNLTIKEFFAIHIFPMYCLLTMSLSLLIVKNISVHYILSEVAEIILYIINCSFLSVALYFLSYKNPIWKDIRWLFQNISFRQNAK